MSEIIEKHPFEPFLPENAKLLMLGTFPPAEKRWCMRFYYPNFINDMWRIFGICFYGDKQHFVLEQENRYNLDSIIPFLNEKGIAMYDTATKIRRTKDNASDKDLEIVEEMKKIATQHNKPVSAVAIRFILDYLPESIVLCGAKRPSQVIGNAEGCDWQLSDEEIKLLNEVSA